MRCAEALRVQAHFDGELDAFSATKSERRSEGCAECRTLLKDLSRTRTALRQDLSCASVSAPPALRAQPFWLEAFSGIGGSAIAAVHQSRS
jgi:anti-sigma factor RsiW